MLAELAELDLALARKVHAAAMAAEEPAAIAELSRSYQRLARSLRQTLALQARLKREREQQIRKDGRAAERRRQIRRTVHKADIERAVERYIERETEGEESERLTADLDDLLAEAARRDDFLDIAVETHITRLRQRLGLSAPSVGFGATSPVLCGTGEELNAHRSSPEGHTSGEVAAQRTEGALPAHRDSG